jgi:thiol-disulfide isomerase/thioredoxin
MIFMGCVIGPGLKAQTITGRLSEMPGQRIRLEGFAGFKTYTILETQTDSIGQFMLTFGRADHGMAYLLAEDEKPLLIILNEENVEISGQTLGRPESIKVLHGKENQVFERFAQEHPKREQALSAWRYLERLYTQDPVFTPQLDSRAVIDREMKRISQEDHDFIDRLPADSYTRWYLPVRRLVGSTSSLAQHQVEEIPAALAAFRRLNYADNRLYKSGLYKESLENHFWLIENSGRSIDSVFLEMQRSIDSLLPGLSAHEERFNQVVDFLFDLLERHSHFAASEYLAISVLNQTRCTLNGDLARQLETYRAMKKGNIAPDIIFGDHIRLPLDRQNDQTTIQVQPKRLSEVKAKYYAVAFGASWCPKCRSELPELLGAYSKWKSHGLEVIYISLDDRKEDFEKFTIDWPFSSYCDYQKWESRAAVDYYVYATPSLFLLNENRQILLRPQSVKQLDAWVDWYLARANPVRH